MSNQVNCIDLIKYGRVVDLYVLARFCYRVGEELIDSSTGNPIDDALYEKIHNVVKLQGNCSDIVNRSYDDDPIPYSLLREFNMMDLVPDFSKWSDKYGRAIEDEKSMSINAIESYKETYDYFMDKLGETLVMSTKVNGINCKSYYSREQEEGNNNLDFRIAKSRGRNGESFDLTKGLSRIVPTTIKEPNVGLSHSDVFQTDTEPNDKQVNPFKDANALFIHGEAVVSSSAIGVLKSPTGVMPKVERMAAMSMLRTTYADEDYKYLKYKVFRCEGLSDSLSESLRILSENGFDVVPYLVINPNEYPTDFDEFCVWLKDKMTYFYNKCEEQDFVADGIVVDVDDINYVGNVNGQYSDKNVALKFEYWSHKYYIGKVVGLEFTQCATKCSVVAQIEPCRTGDNCLAKNVNLHSPAIMFKEKIKPGSSIYFKRDSEVINNLVYGAELRELLGGANFDNNG